MDQHRRDVILHARAAIAHMRAIDTHFAAQPSRMWRENVDAFRYLLEGDDLSPFDTLRGHTHHITGEPGRKLHRVASGPPALVDRLVDRAVAIGLIDGRRARAIHFRRWLRAARPAPVLLEAVVEPAVLGGEAISSSVVDGRPYNFETSRFLATLVNLSEWGRVPLDREGLRVMDIGSGWGGLAYFARAVAPGSHVALIDLPETFIFSMPYLMFTDPERTFYVPSEREGIGDPSAIDRVDYAFYSPGILERFPDRSFDLIMNTGSMAEMSQEQVLYYIGQIKRIGRGAFYSLNEDRQGRNRELGSLTGILTREFTAVQGRHALAPFMALACSW